MIAAIRVEAHTLTPKEVSGQKSLSQPKCPSPGDEPANPQQKENAAQYKQRHASGWSHGNFRPLLSRNGRQELPTEYTYQQ
jgi:hypothetical protein